MHVRSECSALKEVLGILIDTHRWCPGVSASSNDRALNGSACCSSFR
jgi:hypothetical protein